MKNRVKELLEAGKPAVGSWVSLPSAASAELMAGMGFDWLVVDTEHGATDYETLEDMIRAMKGTDTVPMARVPWNDHVLIKRVLDRGAYGLVIPMVSNAEEARAAVSACKYPPEGIRGIAGTRTSRYGMDLMDYYNDWNKEVVVVCQIETQQAVDNIYDILSTPGVDAVFVGPNDLSAGLGVFRQFDHPRFQEAMERIIKAGKETGTAIGYHTGGADEALAKIAQGFQFVAVASDVRFMAGAASGATAKIFGGTKK
ncbi:MAG: HpcH/HpaI aldolase family protein [Syntrophothermus sp.]